MAKKIWQVLGDTRIAFFLLLATSVALFTGSFYAENNFSLFRQLNHMRIQDWFTAHWAIEPEKIWWIPLLFLFMTGLGINTLCCASSRIAALFRHRRTWPAGKFFHLLIPSLIHLFFLVIMLGHLTTFTAGNWQSFPLKADGKLLLDGGHRTYRVKEIRDRFFPQNSGLQNRIAQTCVTLATADGEKTHLAYTRPVFAHGRFLLLDKIRSDKKASEKTTRPQADKETCNKASVYVEKDKLQKKGRQRLLVVADPGFPLVVIGLALIIALMIGYFLFQTNGNGRALKRGIGT